MTSIEDQIAYSTATTTTTKSFSRLPWHLAKVCGAARARNNLIQFIKINLVYRILNWAIIKREFPFFPGPNSQKWSEFFKLNPQEKQMDIILQNLLVHWFPFFLLLSSLLWILWILARVWKEGIEIESEAIPRITSYYVVSWNPKMHFGFVSF